MVDNEEYIQILLARMDIGIGDSALSKGNLYLSLGLVIAPSFAKITEVSNDTTSGYIRPPKFVVEEYLAYLRLRDKQWVKFLNMTHEFHDALILDIERTFNLWQKEAI